MPKISIVVVSFNSKDVIKPCLDSIFNQKYGDCEVIVIDNASSDETAASIKSGYPKVSLIENKENLGPCKARNQGILASSGKWVLCLDCDTVLGEGFLNEMMSLAEDSRYPVGMFQPKILKYDKKNIYSCGISLSGIRRFYDKGKGKLDNGQFDKSGYVFGACSASALYKREMLEEIREYNGYFDERFFFLVEDVDLAWRAQKKGWRAVFSPQAVCYHNGNSSGYGKSLRQYLCFRNRFFLIWKNDNLIGKIKLIPVFILYDFPRLAFLLFNYRKLNLRKQEVFSLTHFNKTVPS